MTIEVVDRTAWGGGPKRYGHEAPHEQFHRLIAHHTVIVMQDYDRDGYLNGDRDDVIRYMQHLQTAREDLGFEVPYSWVIFYGATDDSCIIGEGRGWGYTGAHTQGWNSKAYGVAFAGDFTTEHLTPGMLAGFRWLGCQLANAPYAEATLGHRDTKATACPGENIYKHLDAMQPPFMFTPSIVVKDDEMDMYVEVQDTLNVGQIWHCFWRDTADGGSVFIKKHVTTEWVALRHKFEPQLFKLTWDQIAGLPEVA